VQRASYARQNIIILCSVVAAFSLLVVFVTADSPAAKGESNLLHWWVGITLVALALLAIVLHNEPAQQERQRFIRLFFWGEFFVLAGLAALALWREVEAGRPLW
jgi:hypothetical protein